ncbi:hypothetical protein EGR_08124 [Echinococcus granulosus]|uniref:Uncharacterized protein n=1 Tax=Echinococcus granulosus TaxID=6210 RepID=W6U740_ECHGR|nr:hypothetical protein EGR_08124 [Echinococcus granulosus]EUB57048.1 hypothetical protein EGR_08124 [Echinococcus granulosus]
METLKDWWEKEEEEEEEEKDEDSGIVKVKTEPQEVLMEVNQKIMCTFHTESCKMRKKLVCFWFILNAIDREKGLGSLALFGDQNACKLYIGDVIVVTKYIELDNQPMN